MKPAPLASMKPAPPEARATTPRERSMRLHARYSALQPRLQKQARSVYRSFASVPCIHRGTRRRAAVGAFKSRVSRLLLPRKNECMCACKEGCVDRQRTDMSCVLTDSGQKSPCTHTCTHSYVSTDRGQMCVDRKKAGGAQVRKGQVESGSRADQLRRSSHASRAN